VISKYPSSSTSSCYVPSIPTLLSLSLSLSLHPLTLTFQPTREFMNGGGKRERAHTHSLLEVRETVVPGRVLCGTGEGGKIFSPSLIYFFRKISLPRACEARASRPSLTRTNLWVGRCITQEGRTLTEWFWPPEQRGRRDYGKNGSRIVGPS
jgi:hypothetical protein